MDKSVQFTYIEQPSLERFEREIHIQLHKEGFTGYRWMGPSDYMLVFTEEKAKLNLDILLTLQIKDEQS